MEWILLANDAEPGAGDQAANDLLRKKSLAEIDKLEAERRSIDAQLGFGAKFLEALKSFGAIAGILITLVTLYISSAQWRQEFSRSTADKAQERLEATLANLTVKEEGVRLGAVLALRATLPSADASTQRVVLESLLTTVAFDPSPQVRRAIVSVFDYKVVSPPPELAQQLLNTAVSLSRQMMQAKGFQDGLTLGAYEPVDENSLEGKALTLSHLIVEFLKDGAVPERQDLSSVYCKQCDFSSMNLDGVSFSNAYLVGANFSHAKLSQAKFDGADLSNAKLDCTKADSAIFELAAQTMDERYWKRLKPNNFDDIVYILPSFRGADLSKADFHGSRWFCFTPRPHDSTISAEQPPSFPVPN